MDFMADFAVPFPIIVIAELLGVPAEDRREFRAWSNALVRGIDAFGQNPEVVRQGQEADQALANYFDELIAQRRAKLRNDLISALIAAHDGNDRLSEEELIGMCQLLLIASHETTVNLLGNGLYLLLRHREQWELLLRRPELLESAIEEMLRYESPVQRGTARFAVAPPWRSPVRPSRLASKSARSSPRPTAPLPTSPSRTASTSSASPTTTLPSVGASTSVWARRWPVPRPALPSASCWPAFRPWSWSTDVPQWGGNTFLRGLRALPVHW